MSGWEIAGVIVACYVALMYGVTWVMVRLISGGKGRHLPPASFADAQYRERVYQYRMDAHR